METTIFDNPKFLPYWFRLVRYFVRNPGATIRAGAAVVAQWWSKTLEVVG